VRDVRNSLMRKLFSNSNIINFGLKRCILVMYYAILCVSGIHVRVMCQVLILLFLAVPKIFNILREYHISAMGHLTIGKIFRQGLVARGPLVST
jgi:hypothetical protein